MTRKQFQRYETICRTLDGSMTVKEAADILNLSTRQIQRLKKEVDAKGPAALIHAGTGHTPSNAISQETINTIIQLKQSEKFAACNFLHFQEILEEHYQIKISYSSLRSLLNSHGIQSPKKRRRYKPHRRRSRRPQAGALIQVDATPFAWFKGDRKRYALHGAIDDATGQITSLFMTKNECLAGYFTMMRQTIEHFGIPVSLYADRHTIFRSPNADKAEINSDLSANDTQFGQALKELGVELIPARSPQAKGRIERLWQTLQSRLPIEFELHGIQDIASANEFLKKYIYVYNSQFAVEPKSYDSLFCPIEPDICLDEILCIKETRKIDAGGVFSYKSKSYKIIDNEYTLNLYAGASITILVHPSYGIKARYNNHIIEVLPFVPPKRKKKEPSAPKSKSHAVPASHPYKTGTMYISAKSDQNWTETVEMVNEIFSAKY